MRLTTDFDKLSFHDASVEKIERSDGEVSFWFTGGFVSEVHPQNDARNRVIETGVLRLVGVSGERATHWSDATYGKPHPQPAFPLDEIMHASFDGVEFHFDGFLNGEPWFEWFVQAIGFELEVLANHDASL